MTATRGRAPGIAVAACAAALALAVLCGARPAGGGEAPVGEASDREARGAIRAFGDAMRTREPATRIDAVRALAVTTHRKVAERLVIFTAQEEDVEVLVVAYDALARQGRCADQAVPRLVRRLGEEADAAKARVAKGEGGFRTDPRTGDADTTSAEGQAHLLATRRRATATAALLSTLARLGWTPEDGRQDLTPLLQDASDDLVIALLGALGRGKVATALPAVLDLWRMYPTEERWETGAVVDLAGTNATAKAKWMVRFGHPDKQRPRPAVVRAIRAFLESATGKAFETPSQLQLHLAQLGAAAGGKTSRRGRGAEGS